MGLKGKGFTSAVGVPVINYLHPHKAHVPNIQVPLTGHPNN